MKQLSAPYPTHSPLHIEACSVLHTVHCILHTERCTLHTARCTLPNSHCSQLTLHCKVSYVAQHYLIYLSYIYLLWESKSKMHTSPCIVYTARGTLNNIHYKLKSARMYTAHCTLHCTALHCTLNPTLHTAYHTTKLTLSTTLQN